MKKRIIKKILLVICLMTLVSFYKMYDVFAEGAAIGGNGKPGSGGSSCPNCAWVYNYKGLRFSLYKYNGDNLSYYGSVDYCADSSCWNGYVYQSQKAGKVAYQHLSDTYNASNTWEKSNINIKANDYFNLDYFNSGYENSGLDAKVKEFFNIFEGKSINEIIHKIKEVFPGASNLSANDARMIYITVEPTLYVVGNVTNVDSDTGDTTTIEGRYYGTAYELNKFFHNGPWLSKLDNGAIKGIDGHLYSYLGNSVRITKIEGTPDPYKFIGNLVYMAPNALTTDVWYKNKTLNRKGNASKITSDYGYGIVVYWLGNYVPEATQPSCTISESTDKKNYTLKVINTSGTVYYDIGNSLNNLKHNVKNKTYSAFEYESEVVGAIYNEQGNRVATCKKTRNVPTCKSSCSGKSGDDLLGCAENYCSYSTKYASADVDGNGVVNDIDAELIMSYATGNGENLTSTQLSLVKSLGDVDSNGAINSTDASLVLQYAGGKLEGKATCINSCGYSDPGFSTCSNNTSSNGKDTECDAETTANKKTCTEANANNYYKRVCDDKSTITYGNSLPTTLMPGSGFSYTPVISGSKTCTMTFEANKWKYDYAVASVSSERTSLLEKLNNFKKIDSTSIWAKDVQNIYKYKSNDATIEIEVTNSNVAGASNKTTTKRLVADKTVNLLVDNVKVSSGGSYSVPLFNGGAKTVQTIYSTIKTTSSNKTSYKLPGTCMNSGEGTLYDINNNGTCESTNDGPYYKYYTSLDITKGIYGTVTKVSKSSSTLDVKNTCNYNVNLPVSCSIKVVDCKNNEPEKAELRIENKYNLNIRYGFSTIKGTLNNKKTYDITQTTKKLYGSIAIDGEVVATCSLDVTTATCGNDDNSTCKQRYKPTETESIKNYCSTYWKDDAANYSSEADCYTSCTSTETVDTCKTQYKPTEYAKIRDYCSTSWMNDAANYSSEADCYNSCSSGSNTCKNNPDVDTSNIDSVTNFCSSKKNREENGYNRTNSDEHNKAMCINDCIDSGGTPEGTPGGGNCLGVTCDYLYRPISLIDPFPNNRKPGYNWYGKEIFITDDLLNPVLNPTGAEPEYEIELTPEIMDTINKQTDTYNKGKNKNAYIDYVYNNENKKTGKYISKFIHSTDEVTGGFSSYFTKTKN